MLQKGKTYYKIRNIKTMILDITRVSDPDPVFLPGSGSGFSTRILDLDPIHKCVEIVL